MKCPYCQSVSSKVIDKRGVDGRGEIRRRRECLSCSRRFTTYEGLAILKILVIKKDGRKEEYNQDKLKNGLLKALEKRPGIDKLEMLVDKIEARIRLKGVKEITSTDLGNWILKALKKMDSVAYLRFASVYRTFENARDFEKELKSL